MRISLRINQISRQHCKRRAYKRICNSDVRFACWHELHECSEKSTDNKECVIRQHSCHLSIYLNFRDESIWIVLANILCGLFRRFRRHDGGMFFHFQHEMYAKIFHCSSLSIIVPVCFDFFRCIISQFLKNDIYTEHCERINGNMNNPRKHFSFSKISLNVSPMIVNWCQYE